jgi:hypothetical protein
MDFWHETEIRMRRDAVVQNAKRSRSIGRTSESGTSVRGRIAGGAQAMSDALAALARNLRDERV